MRKKKKSLETCSSETAQKIEFFSKDVKRNRAAIGPPKKIEDTNKEKEK